jgi:DNA-binding MarR family transcriptional regulator
MSFEVGRSRPSAAAPASDGTRWLDQDEQTAWRAWLYSTQLLQERLERDLTREAGISHAYYEILVKLSEAPDRRMRMSQLADECLSSRSRLSHAVSRLEERGWIRREPCAEDARGQLAILTDEGFAALQSAAPVHVESVRTHLFDQLSPAQIAAMQDIGETLMRHLRER